MRKSELKKLVSDYDALKLKLAKHNMHDSGIQEKLAEIRHRYFHETGNDIESDLKQRA